MKKVLVTGGNKGIGKAIAKKLVLKDYQVLILSRNPDNGIKAVEDIIQESNKKSITFIQGDLSSIESCMLLIEKIKTDHPDLSILINNAGIWPIRKELNQDGLEMGFMVNYLAPYLLCTQLKSFLIKNAPARIVNVNAGLYIKGKLDIEQTPYGLDFHKIKTYANTKLCNVLFTRDFAQEIEDSGLIINAVHPGVIQTDLGSFGGIMGILLKLIKRTWKKPDYGAIAPVWLATNEEAKGFHGLYFNEKEIMAYSELAKNTELQQQLRNWTKEFLRK